MYFFFLAYFLKSNSSCSFFSSVIFISAWHLHPPPPQCSRNVKICSKMNLSSVFLLYHTSSRFNTLSSSLLLSLSRMMLCLSSLVSVCLNVSFVLLHVNESFVRREFVLAIQKSLAFSLSLTHSRTSVHLPKTRSSLSAEGQRSSNAPEVRLTVC